jgi:ferric iron reductase protein FhuF
LTGWATTAELAGPRLHDALRACGESLNTDRPDIQGQRLVEVVTWLLAVPIATALIEERPLPDLHPDRVELWIGDEPPEGDGLKLRDRQATPQAPAHAQLHAHLDPLIRAVNYTTKRPANALWRGAKDRMDGAIAWIAETTDQRERAFALLEDTAELRLLDLGTHELLLHVRKGCCLYYRTPANVKCFSCPLLDDEERRRLSGAL